MRPTSSLAVLAALLSLAPPAARAQEALPSADSVLAAFHRAAGGEARLAAIRDATYEWTVSSGGRVTGEARSLRKRPGSLREEFANGMANVSSPRAVWSRGPGGAVRVASGAGVPGSRLQAALEASFLTRLAEQGIEARVLGRDTADGGEVWRVEFSRSDGGRRTYLFGAESGLVRRIEISRERGVFVRYADWRGVDGVLEPHRVEIVSPGGAITFALKSARYDTGVEDAAFDPPPPPASAPAPAPAAPG